MKKLKKAPKILKSINEIPKFSDKHGFDLFKIKKSWKYYFKKTKRNVSSALDYTLNYIDQCYIGKQYSPKMDEEEKIKNKNNLLLRFNELSKKHKYSYSIISSVAGSFLISFLFLLLQTHGDEELTFWEQIFKSINSMFEELAKADIITSIVLLPLIFIVICILLVVPVCILIFTYVILDALYYSNYRNMVVPYERKVILKTLQSYDGRYKELD